MTASDKVPGAEDQQNHLRTCKRCGLTYDWRRSPSSSLKMTYCGSLCEQGDLGFTLEALLRAPSEEKKELPAPAEPTA